MKTMRFVVATMLAIGFTACGDDDGGSGVDIRGLTPEQAADEAAQAVCEREEACGAVSYECSSDGSGNTTCTGTIEPAVYSDCYTDFSEDIRGDLESCSLTEEEELAVNDCVNAMADLPCLTQDQVDANAEAMENDEDPPYQSEPPAECLSMGTIFESCSQ